jgi:hypothetical protein
MYIVFLSMKEKYIFLPSLMVYIKLMNQVDLKIILLCVIKHVLYRLGLSLRKQWRNYSKVRYFTFDLTGGIL